MARRPLIWGLVLSALSVGLAFVPLLSVVGFEFAFVLGVVGSFAGADLAAAHVRRMRAQGARVGVPRLWARAALTNLAVLLPPLAIMSLNGLRVRNCDLLHGLYFYLCLPGISSLFATAVGVSAALIFSRHPKLGAAAAWLFVVASLVIGVVRFYRAPAIFGYDPFAGYFPGTLYDENIRLGAAFWWSRLYQLALATAVLAGCAAHLDQAALALRAQLRRALPIAIAAASAISGAVLLGNAASLGFVITAPDIARELGGRRETAHFVIYYPSGAAFENEMDAIAQEHELRWAQVERVFGVAPAGKITSFYFASSAQKAHFMGAENTYIAKPWRKEIYISHEEFPHDSLRHEIAHVFAGEFGDPLFHVSVKWWAWPPAQFNVGLIEGAAVAADWPTLSPTHLTPHQAVKAMLELGLLPPLRAILAPDFFRFSSAQSYTTAGSFCHFLIETYGAPKFRALYRSGGRPPDFLLVYGRPLEDLEREWRAEVQSATLADEDMEVARDRFRRPGIFKRPCPHDVARLESRAAALIAAGRAAEAAQLLAQVCTDDPGEPAHRLALAAAWERADRDGEARSIYEAVLAGDPPPTSGLRARAYLRLIDLLVRAADLPAARTALDAAIKLPVDEATRRNLMVRRIALGDGPGAEALMRYLFSRTHGEGPDLAQQLEWAHDVADAMSGNGLGHYLAGRILTTRHAHADASRELARAHELGLPEPLVARENDRLLTAAAFLAGDLATARAAATRLTADTQPEGVRLEGKDWLERCAFAETGALPAL